MSILVLNRAPLRQMRYRLWLEDTDEPIVVLASQEKLAAYGEDLAEFAPAYAHAEAFPRYDSNGLVEARAIELHRHHRFRRVVAMAEYDMVRAARLREHLGIPGQDAYSADAFRDKLAMKRICAAAAVPVPAFADLRSPVDLIAFVEAHGFPVVVKPRRGTASSGVKVIRTGEQLQQFLAGGLSPSPVEEPGLMAEAFVEGIMYHVDGIVVDRRPLLVWPSQYLNGAMSYTRNVSFNSRLLDAENGARPRLQQLVRQVLGALPTPAVTTFHAEVFHTPDDRLVLCEIASRTGGAKVNEVTETAFGLNLNAAWMRASCGLPVNFPDWQNARDPRPRGSAGWLLVPPRPGVVEAVPGQCPLPWVTQYQVLTGPGARLGNAAFSVDHIAAMVLTGADEIEVADRLDEAERWFWEQTRLAPLGDAARGAA